MFIKTYKEILGGAMEFEQNSIPGKTALWVFPRRGDWGDYEELQVHDSDA